MRIAFIVNDFPVLSQTFILNQITGLLDRNHEVDIYAGRPSEDGKVHLDVKKYDLLSKTYYFNVPPSRIVRIAKGIKLLLTSINKNPILVYKILSSFIFTRRAVLSQWMIPYIAIPILEKQSYDIIHCHFGPRGLDGAQLKILGLFEGKLVTTFHGYDITTFIQTYNNKLINKIFRRNVYRRLFEIGDLFLPISNCWKQKLVELGCDENKICVHRMGVNVNKFTFTPRSVEPGHNVKILTIARLVEKKGIEYGIRAVAKLVETNQCVEYNIVGNGPLRENLQQLISELKVDQYVKLLGWKQQREVVELLNKSHILLAPSVTSKHGDQEGIPVVLMEAMAMGLPVISTEHSGIPELVEHDVSGFLVPERDVDALTEKLRYMVEHSEIWPEMGKAGRNRVETHYNIDTLNERLIDTYEQI